MNARLSRKSTADPCSDFRSPDVVILDLPSQVDVIGGSVITLRQHTDGLVIVLSGRFGAMERASFARADSGDLVQVALFLGPVARRGAPAPLDGQPAAHQ